MKKFAKLVSFLTVVAVLMSMVSFAIAAPKKSETAGSKGTANVYKGTPKVDGKGTDACWKTATVFKLTKLTTNSTKKDANHATAVAKVCWDEKNIYVYAVVKDKTTFEKYTLLDHRSDSIEFFIDAKNTKTKQNQPVNNAQYRLNILSKVTGWADYDRNTFKKQAFAVKTKDGYVMEVAIPLTSHGVKGAAGMKVGFDLALNDSIDGKDRQYTVSWFQNDVGYTEPSSLGTITLKA